jgi:hypothetical protein
MTTSNNLNANNQGDIFEPMMEENQEIDEDREDNNSIGEEGGRSEGRYELNEAVYHQMTDFNQIDPEEGDIYDDQT